MTVLPDLRRELLRVAALQTDGAPAASRRPRHRRAPLLTGLACLVVAGGATAAVGGLLPGGDPVPRDQEFARFGTLVPGSTLVLPLRAADPDGGPPWGISVFDVAANPPAPGLAGGRPRCVRFGRVQGGRLGVVGRDGFFANDGKFHVLPEQAPATGTCGGTFRDGQLLISKGGSDTPASGYSGGVSQEIGGCLLFRPKRATSSPQTRKRLAGVPLCSATGRRIVKYGFAGRLAREVRLRNNRIDVRLTPGPQGSYLYVTRPVVGDQKLTTIVTYADGTVCTNPAAPRLAPTTGPCAPPPGF